MHDLSQSNFKARTEEGFPESVRVASTSGHRTLRSILKTPADHSAASQAILDGLRDLGCSYEGAHPGFTRFRP